MECLKFAKREINADDENSDFEIVKKQYEKWLKAFEENNFVPSKKNERIVEEIINFYVLNRFEVLQKVLSIKDDDNLEKFKYMIKNYLRKYFAKRILDYYNSEEFNSISFFAKRKKRNEILNFLDNIGKYEFNKKEFDKIFM